jgi:cyclophilin family peptidyl-prolyl cis-trans isomerase
MTWRRARAALVAVALAGGFGTVGCDKKVDANAAKPDGGPSAGPVAAAGDRDNKPAGETPPPNDAQHQPFAKATRSGDDPPDGVLPPPDTTLAGKAVGKLYTDVIRSWDSVRFVDSQGKHIDYSARVETDLGSFTITLRPDIAPNHVRNFIVLARLGYYDGLAFERLRDEQPEDGSGRVLQTLEAGCPLGTGDPRSGHLGYWLLPEFPREDAKVSHEAGTVGACHGDEADTACCRFYITLGPAPFLDGNYSVFGKVSNGLDVARAIFNRPSVIEEQDPDGSRRPQKPVIIRKVTIQERPGASSAGGGGVQ